jgi:glycerol-3-phosphate dehydrogenase
VTDVVVRPDVAANGIATMHYMELRASNVARLDGGTFDALIVGGGINGAVSAAVLAGRGLNVAIIDRGDWAGFTSSSSSNLAWGGFKYLENYELNLVRKLSMSRNRLLRAYPSNISQLGFLAALDHGSPFPPWLAALGSSAYWAIGNFQTHRPQILGPEEIKSEEPVIKIDNVRGGIEYYDAYLRDNDSRFVFNFIRQAIEAGATAANYVELIEANQHGANWNVELEDLETGAPIALTAKAIVNAAGPFVDGLNEKWGNTTSHRIVYSKGIHLVVPQLTESERVLAFFDDTQRLFYVIPMGRRSVIGTTDTRVPTPFTEVTNEDRDFLLEQINNRLDLDAPLTRSDIIAERCGVRPLVVPNDGDDKEDIDWTTLSRKHEIDLDVERRIVTIFGGKITDCLNVGEEVAAEIEKLGFVLEADVGDWYGEPTDEVRADFMRQAKRMKLDKLRHKKGVEPLSERLWRRYGRRAFTMLDTIREDPRMGEDILKSADYLRAELHHAARHEMVTHLEDFMLRRSKIDLVVRNEKIREGEGLAEVSRILFGDDGDAKLADYLAKKDAVAAI